MAGSPTLPNRETYGSPALSRESTARTICAKDIRSNLNLFSDPTVYVCSMELGWMVGRDYKVRDIMGSDIGTTSSSLVNMDFYRSC